MSVPLIFTVPPMMSNIVFSLKSTITLSAIELFSLINNVDSRIFKFPFSAINILFVVPSLTPLKFNVPFASVKVILPSQLSLLSIFTVPDVIVI